MIKRCPICESYRRVLVARFDSPPTGERDTHAALYDRRLWNCRICGHFYNDHNMPTDYSGGYVDVHYKDAEGLKKEYERIMGLPEGQSDNYRRVQRIARVLSERAFSIQHILLDVGAGLGVFVSRMEQEGWRCTALDPDHRATSHIAEYLNIKAVCADWRTTEIFGKFDVVTHIKTLEHILDPIVYLQRTHEFLQPGGTVYIEIPSGELAIKEGPERQEFFYEHWHAFSFTSLSMMVTKAGFWVEEAKSVKEPSGKFTLFAFLREG